MYKLFWSPGSAAMAPQAVLEEIGAPYDLVKLDVAGREHQQDEYRRFNPTGRIPTLVHGDFVIFETAAICQYLADLHPEAGLAPANGSAARGRYYQWLAYLNNTVQVGLNEWFHPEWTLADADIHDDLKAAAAERLYGNFDVLNGSIGTSDYMLGESFTLCDIYIAMLARWTRFLDRPMWRWSNIERVVGATYTRPAFQRMLQKQGIGWPENWGK